MASKSLEIYTIGHSTLDMDDFLRLLKENYVKVLVDVRSKPYSRFNPQFNHDSLKHAMAYAGLEYVFAGQHLGGRPSDPTCNQDNVVPDDKADYLKLVDYKQVMERDWYQRAIERLLEVASKRLTAIMCSEEDPAHCHRHHLVTQSLLDRGITVWHIRSDGSVEKARPLPAVAQQLPLL